MMTEPSWRKSSYSGEGNCVELSGRAGRVLVRDTQDLQGPVLNRRSPPGHGASSSARYKSADPTPGPLAFCSVECRGS